MLADLRGGKTPVMANAWPNTEMRRDAHSGSPEDWQSSGLEGRHGAPRPGQAVSAADAGAPEQLDCQPHMVHLSLPPLASSEVPLSSLRQES